MKRHFALWGSAIAFTILAVMNSPAGFTTWPNTVNGSGGGGGSSGTNGNFYNLIVTNNLIIPDNGLGGGTNFVPTLWVNQQMFYGDSQNHYTNGDNTLSYWYSQWVSDSFTFGSRQNAGSVFVYSTNGDFSIAGNLTANSITTQNATINASGGGTFTDIGNMSWISTGGKIVYAQNANGNLALAGTAVTTIDSFFNGIVQFIVQTNLPSGVLITNNYGFNITVQDYQVILTNAAVAGSSTMSLRRPGLSTNTICSMVTALGIAQTGAMYFGGTTFTVTNGQAFGFFNTSSGTGNGSAIQGGQFKN